ncbi:glutamate ABC transporter substrate-binding protein [Streptomyces sp. HUAS ZL42]|uniref:glutamate ABC transporter substrate-binding protein n=1 Tax=Streptomyces sp. HUAS ZL42 TaxID=3231715 RepID=UPI00345F115F
MAAVCALALALVLLLPLTQPHGGGGADLGGQKVAKGSRTKAATCDESTVQDQSPAPSDADGITIDAIKKRGYLSVGVDQNSYRWGYLNPNNPSGELEGFDIDLVHAIARNIFGDDTKERIQFRAIPTNQRVPAIQSGRVDMVVRTMTITCTRLEQVAFSAPYFKTGQQVLAPKTSTIKGYDATLAGKKICSAKGSTAHDKLDADKKAGKIPSTTDIDTQVPNQLDCLVRLQLAQVDAVVTDGALAASQAAQDLTVQLKGTTFTTEYYGVAMKKGATDLVRRVNRILETYRADGSWKASYDKWLSATLGTKSESATPPAARYK